MKGQPFKRANLLLSVISQIMAATGNDFVERQAQLAALPRYESRGKGKGMTQKAPKHKHMSLVRAAKKKHNINKRK